MTQGLQKRRLGKTGLKVGIFGFGCLRFPNVSAAEVAASLDRAIDLGVNFLDTARRYGDSEEKIGPALQRRRDQIYVASKTLARTASEAMEEIETSLRHLQTDVVDLYQAHFVCGHDVLDQVIGPGGALEAFTKAKQQGKIRHYGITLHRDLDTIRRAIECDLFETVMLAYNPVDEENTGHLLPLAKQHDLGVIVMKPLCGGLLVSRPGAPRLDGLDPVVAGALRAIAANPHVDTVIAGMISVAQVEENFRAITAAGGFVDEVHRELSQTIAGLREELRYGWLCYGCGYCTPCTQGIEIPRVFRALSLHRRYPGDSIGKRLYDSLATPADTCEECGACRCPAQIDIPARLKEAVAAFGARA